MHRRRLRKIRARALTRRGVRAAIAAALLQAAALAGCTNLRARDLAGPGGRGPVVVAHRGASAYAPENTIASFREAWERGARIAECDVHLSADGEVIVMHDPTVDRTTDGVGEVRQLTVEELARLDAGSKFAPRFVGEPVPTLGQVLDFVRNRMVLFIEVKSGPETIEPIFNLLRARGRQIRQVAVISFDPEVVARSEARMPEVPTMLLLWTDPGAAAAGPAAVEQALSLGAEMVGVPSHGVSSALIEAAHSARIGVFVYTVNDAARVVSLAERGVDGIHTDAPDFVKEVLEAAPL